MNIITISRTSEMNTLQHVANVRSSSYSMEVRFGTSTFGASKVKFKMDSRSRKWKLSEVEIDYRSTWLMFGTDYEKLSAAEMQLVGAALIATKQDVVLCGDALIALEECRDAVIVERTVYVERPVVVEHRRQETTTVRRTVITSHNPEMDAAVALGAAVGAGLGLLGSILRNRH
jgi:hypothetical protein